LGLGVEEVLSDKVVAKLVVAEELVSKRVDSGADEEMLGAA